MVLSFTEKLNNEEKWDILSAKTWAKTKEAIFLLSSANISLQNSVEKTWKEE